MKKSVSASFAGLAAGLIILTTAGCDWSSGGGTNAFNTSQGAGIDINFSGFYRGELTGGKAVQNTSNGNILSFNIAQVGNSLTVRDNQGSTYNGSVGSPGRVADPVRGVFPAGAQIVQSQVNWSGKDGVAAKDIDFVGTIHLVSVIDIKQDIKSSSESSTSTDSSSSTTTVLGNNTTQIVTIEVDGDTTTTITTLQQTDTGEIISSNTSVTRTDDSSTFDGYQITEANSQYRLEGTWVEVDGKVSPVQARSAGSSGVVIVEESDNTITPL